MSTPGGSSPVPPPAGPLAGVTVLELGGIGPGPFAGMMLADLGARVIRLVRGPGWDRYPILHRGRTAIDVDLKDPAGAAAVRTMAAGADVVIEGFRPGVAERLGLGPEDLLAVNPGLVYGRMTGWGQEGPWADTPGHDINYLGLTGALHAIGEKGRDPVPPLNLVADFGGGGMLLAYGIACALLSTRATGKGQVVDAAMVDGASSLMAMTYGFLASGMWIDDRGSNLLDGAAPFYRTYRCADEGHMAVGCIEPPFYRAFLEVLDLSDDELFSQQLDRSRWDEQAERIAAIFATKPRADWEDAFARTDACTTPVLSMTEAPHHPHVAARATFVEVDGVMQPVPAPRFSATPAPLPPRMSADRASIERALADVGIGAEEAAGLIDAGLVAVPQQQI